MITGWGATSYESGDNPATLLQATLKIVNQAYCKKAFQQWTEITDEQICAGVEGWDKDSCQGDSGKAQIWFRDRSGPILVAILNGN